MDKKFLSAEEAASQFGIDPAEFQKLVDEGELKALADRGSWKYRRDEIAQLIEAGKLPALHPQGDGVAESAPVDDFSFLEIDDEAIEEGTANATPHTDFAFDDDDASSPKMTEIDSGFASDDEIMMIESDPDVPMMSSAPTPPAVDVHADDAPVVEESSVAEIVLEDGPQAAATAAADNLQELAAAAGESSIILTDVEPSGESDSDVKVVNEAAGVRPAVPAAWTDPDASPSDSSLLTPLDAGIVHSDSDVRIADSGISLESEDAGSAIDSGIKLNADSGLTLEADSGITLEAGDSGISLEGPDSGLTLEAAADSGISLEGIDSGLSLTDADSGIALSGAPASRRGAKPADTLPEFDHLGDSGDHTSMLASVEDSAEVPAAAAKGKKAKSPSLSDSFTMDDEVEDLEIVEDLEAGELAVDSSAELEEDVAEFEDEDILDASDEAFSEADSGVLSDEGSIASVPVMKTVAKEPPWGVVTILPIAACALLLLVQGLLLWDGISTMWSGDTSKAIGASVIDSLSGLM